LGTSDTGQSSFAPQTTLTAIPLGAGQTHFTLGTSGTDFALRTLERPYVDFLAVSENENEMAFVNPGLRNGATVAAFPAVATVDPRFPANPRLTTFPLRTSGTNFAANTRLSSLALNALGARLTTLALDTLGASGTDLATQAGLTLGTDFAARADLSLNTRFTALALDSAFALRTSLATRPLRADIAFRAGLALGTGFTAFAPDPWQAVLAVDPVASRSAVPAVARKRSLLKRKQAMGDARN
jgi:hypothetical protein